MIPLKWVVRIAKALSLGSQEEMESMFKGTGWPNQLLHFHWREGGMCERRGTKVGRKAGELWKLPSSFLHSLGNTGNEIYPLRVR